MIESKRAHFSSNFSIVIQVCSNIYIVRELVDEYERQPISDTDYVCHILSLGSSAVSVVIYYETFV